MFLRLVVGWVVAKGGVDVAQATMNAYAINRMLLDTEPVDFSPYDQAFAALLSVSASMQTALVGLGVGLTQEYVAIECAEDVCMPADVPGKPLSEAFAVFAKAENEPHSGSGDFDGDGAANAEEAANVSANGGGAPEYAAAASDPTTDGSLAEGPGGCSASAGGTGRLEDWLSLLAIVLLAMGPLAAFKRTNHKRV